MGKTTLFAKFGIVEDRATILGYIKDNCTLSSKKHFNDNNLVSYLNSSAKLYNYFCKNGEEYKRVDLEDEANLKVVDISYRNNSGAPIFAVFISDGKRWVHIDIGTYADIKEKYKLVYSSEKKEKKEKRKKEIVSEKNEFNLDIIDESEDDTTSKPILEFNKKHEKWGYQFCKKIYDILLMPQTFIRNSKEIFFYISAIVSRINSLIENGEDISKFVIYNDTSSLALINSALLSKFGQEIYLIVKIIEGKLSYSHIDVCTGLTMLSSIGFKKPNIQELERVRFYNNDVNEMVFNAREEDFDFGNWRRLTHCINDRRARFPSEFKGWSDEMLCSDMINAVKIGIKISKYDSSYIKPIYNIRQDIISFVIPYHLGNNFKKEPELGIIVAKFEDNDYWQIMTVIEKQEAIQDTKTLSLYLKSSFIW